MNILDQELIPVSKAAEALGITEKALLGLMFRNGVTDPIGGDTP